MILSCIQPSYIPWKGYFHIIQKCDIFVFHDDIQYTKQDWRNRNKIKTSSGLKWVTIPVKKVSSNALINEVVIDNSQKWTVKHWRMIQDAYGNAPFFMIYKDFFNEIYSKRWDSLSDFNIFLTKEISKQIGINHVDFVKSSGMNIVGTKTDRIIQFCKKLGANYYISGPSAREYIEPDKFDRNGITLEYIQYNYPEYHQLYDDFVHNVSIIDTLFNCGEEACKYIWGKYTKEYAVSDLNNDNSI